VLALPGNFGPQTAFTILTAQGGLTGSFSGATVNLPFLDPSLSTAGNSVVLTLTRNPTFLTGRALTANQIGVARALDAGPTGNVLFLAAAGESSAGARRAFDLLSGEAHAGAVTTAVEESRHVRDAVLDRLRTASGSVNGSAQNVPAAFSADAPQRPSTVAVPIQTIDPQVFGLWGQGFGSWGRTDATTNAASLDRSTGGFLLGADAAVNEAGRVGVAGGYSRTSFDVTDRLSSGAIESVHGAIYGGAQFGALQLRAGAAVADQSITTSRAVAFGGFADALRASYDGTLFEGFGELAYRLTFGPAMAEPFVQAAAIRMRTDSFAEEGGAAALLGAGRTHDVGFSTVGLRGEARLGPDWPIMARAMAGWRHAGGDITPTALLAFPGVAGSSFLTAGVPIARDSLVVEAGLDYRVARAAKIGISYAGALSDRAQDHAVKGQFEMQF